MFAVIAIGKQLDNFLGFSAVRNGYSNISLGKHADISVDSLSRMEKKCRCAGAGKGRCDFLGDKPRLANADDDYLTGTLVKELYRFDKTFIKLVQ